MRQISALGVALLLTACGQQSTTPSATDELLDLPADNVLSWATSNVTNAGVRVATLTADSAYSFETSRRWDLINVVVTFHDENGAEAGTLTSRTADYNTAEKLFIARENVVLVTQGRDGERRLETEELHFEIAQDIIWTDSPFVLIEDGRVSRGTRFKTDRQFDNWEVTGLRTEGPVPGEGGLTF